MPKRSPVTCTILALVAVTCKREQHRNTFKGHWCGASLRLSNQKLVVVLA